MSEKIRIIVGTLLLLFCNVLLGFMLGFAIKTSGNPFLIVFISLLCCGIIYFDIIIIKWYINRLRK